MKNLFKSPTFIAEISANHNGSLINAKKLIKDAKKYGADYVKLQTYTPNTMTLNSKKKRFRDKQGPLGKNKPLGSIRKSTNAFRMAKEII